MTPPDRLPRLDQLRLLMAQGIDPTREMVLELLSEVDRLTTLNTDSGVKCSKCLKNSQKKNKTQP